MNFNSLPIKTKLNVLWISTSLFSLILACVLFIAYDQYSYRSLLKQEIKVISDIFANRASTMLLFGDEDLGEKILQSIEGYESVEYVCLFKNKQNKNISLFASYYASKDFSGKCDALDKQKYLTAKEVTVSSFRFFEFSRPIYYDNRIEGHLYLNVSLNKVWQRFRDEIAVAFIIVMTLILITYILVNKLQQLVTTPLNKLKNTIEQITERSDYSLRITKETMDEFGVVGDSVNAMLNHIQKNEVVLKENEEKFRLISSSADVGIMQLDKEGFCIFANQRLAEMTGKTRKNIIEQGVLDVVHPDDIDEVKQQWITALKYGESFNFNTRLLINSSTIWVTGHVGMLVNSKGKRIGYLATFSDITELKNAQIKMEQLAYFDSLTGTANRRKLHEELAIETSRFDNKFALMIVDIDHFKRINDSMGHLVGDSLLIAVSKIIKHSISKNDIYGRINGDEFLLILKDKPYDYEVIAQKIINAFKIPINIKPHEILITASIGVVVFPEHGKDSEELFKHAELALHQTKEKNRNGYTVFNDEMNESIIHFMNTEKELRQAIIKQEFVLHYQPIFSLNNSEIVGFEALVRWHKNSEELIYPDGFIAVAEETGLIVPMGAWVIKEACYQMQTWLNKGFIKDTSVIAVNLSVKQFADNNLVDNITQALAESGLATKNLELEVTESMLMENMDVFIDVLLQLKQMGMFITIDDFGTGYSSLSYLKRLPVDVVKVDRSFVMDIPEDKDDMELTTAIISMAHSLKLKVVAEGVETQEQIDFLNKCCCDFSQGYFYSKPIPAEEVEDFCLNFNKNIKSS